MTKYKKLRTVEDKQGLIYIQELKFGFLWWTVFKTRSYAGAKSFLSFSGLNYNEKSGYYE